MIRVDEYAERAEALFSKMDKLGDALTRSYKTDAKAKVALEKAALSFNRIEEELARLHQVKTYEFMSADEWGDAGNNPNTGEYDAKWTEAVIERLLGNDSDWMEMLGDYYVQQENAQVARGVAIEAQNNAQSLHEQIGILRSRATLWAALLNAARAEVD